MSENNKPSKPIAHKNPYGTDPNETRTIYLNDSVRNV